VNALVSGSTYKFKYRVRNIHGWSSYSGEVSVLAASIPDDPTAPETVVENIYVKIEWTAPDGNGEGPTSYEVVLLHSDGVTYTE